AVAEVAASSDACQSHASQQAITAIGGAQQNPCGSNTASLLFVTQQDFGECADQGGLVGETAGAVAGVPAGGNATQQTASQQTITDRRGGAQGPWGTDGA